MTDGAPRRRDPDELLARVQELSERVERLDDAGARELASELVAAVIAMYGDGLERIVAIVRESRDAGATIIDQLAQDGAVGSLLLVHDLYPTSLRERVGEALDTVRPYMESHGGDVELLALGADGVAHLALRGSCDGCAASRATLATAIEQALREHAPDLAGIDVSGVVEEAVSPVTGMALPMADAELPAAAAGLAGERPGAVALPIVQAGGSWTDVDPAQRPSPGALRALTIAGAPVVLADVGGSLLAYADACAGCGEPLRDGLLGAGGLLRCAHCDAEFDLPRAGRATGGGSLQLRPLPLLQSDPGRPLRVAV